MDTLNKWLDNLLNDPAFALLAFVITLLVRLEIWKWLPKRRRARPHKHKAGGTA